ncbi:hypothetical protein LQL77_20065 [Rhodococcus cerastii]|nr:hypothetical protein [Rhodococcus cerastii]
MTDFEFVEVQKFVDEHDEAKDVAAEAKSDEELVEETKSYIQNLFASSGGTE